METTQNIVSINVPMTFRRRGGRRIIIAPSGTEMSPATTPVASNAVVGALARAFRWQKLLNDGTYANLEDIARKEGLCPPFVSRIARLALLTPEIVELIIENRQPDSLTLRRLSKAFPVEWDQQRAHFLLD